jgi:hypothetical protein
VRTGDWGAGWRKSSRSVGGGEQTDCVEVAEFPDHVAMRDSKNPAGPVLAVPLGQWRFFLGSVRTGQFD